MDVVSYVLAIIVMGCMLLALIHEVIVVFFRSADGSGTNSSKKRAFYQTKDSEEIFGDKADIASLSEEVCSKKTDYAALNKNLYK